MRAGRGLMSWSFAAFAVACAALVVAIWDARRGPTEATVYPSAPPVIQAAPAERDHALEARIVELEARLQRVQRLLAKVPAQPLMAKNAGTADAPRSAVEPPAESIEWRAPRAGIDIEVGENGGLRVTNTDPALAGQMLRIEGESPDGESVHTTILVPPPEA